MTHDFLRVPALALSIAAFASFSTLSAARADTSATPAAAAPSLNEPAPTPGWVEGGPAPSASGAMTVQHRPHAAVRPNGSRHARHYARRYGPHYAYFSNNAMAAAANGVVGGVADLGSIAAYPIYCFPNYGSCPVYLPHRF